MYVCVCLCASVSSWVYQCQPASSSTYMPLGLIKKYGKGSRAERGSLLTFSLLQEGEGPGSVSVEGETFITRTIKWHDEHTAQRSC